MIVNSAGFAFQNVNQLREVDSLAYMIGVATEPCELLHDADYMLTLMSTEYEVEDCALYPADVARMKNQWPTGYHPIAPVSVCNSWSPIAWLLALLPEPRFAAKGKYGLAIAEWDLSNVRRLKWEYDDNADIKHLSTILRRMSELSTVEGLVHIVAKPGWSYSDAIDSLCDFSENEIAQLGMVVWKRC
jgi:hypothetical protein